MIPDEMIVACDEGKAMHINFQLSLSSIFFLKQRFCRKGCPDLTQFLDEGSHLILCRGPLHVAYCLGNGQKNHADFLRRRAKATIPNVVRSEMADGSGTAVIEKSKVLPLEKIMPSSFSELEVTKSSNAES